MSYYEIAKGLTGRIPNTPLQLALETVKEALGNIYDQTDWSFQRAITYANWLCPGNVANVGTYNVQPYSNTVTADGAATNALALGLAAAGVFVTTLQFRNPAYSIYNIIASGSASTIAFLQLLTPGANQIPGVYTVNATGGTGSGAVAQITVLANGEVGNAPVILNPGSGYTPSDGVSFPFNEGGTPATFNPLLNTILTLDRPWLEPISGQQNYMIYQVYFVSPVPDFRKFIEVRDTTNSWWLDFTSVTQADLAVYDPQRQEFSDPSYVVPAGVDTRPGSSTLGYPMFELWPHQLSYIPYSFSFRRRGIVPETMADFMNSSPPYPLTESLVRWRAEEVLYQYAEAQRDKTLARGSGANFMLLAQMAQKQYIERLDKILAIDLNLNGEEFNRIPGRPKPLSNQPYSNNLGGLNIGGYPERY